MSENTKKPADVTDDAKPASGTDTPAKPGKAPPKEIGGREGPDPTRYGDWEKAGRCVDF